MSEVREPMNMATKITMVREVGTEEEINSCINDKGQWHEPWCDRVLLAHGAKPADLGLTQLDFKDESGPNLHSTSELMEGRTIINVELGRTPGWILLNLTKLPTDPAEVKRVFLTIFVGGKAHGEEKHYTLSSLHFAYQDGDALCLDPRDYRDPNMPAGAAYKVVEYTHEAANNQSSQD